MGPQQSSARASLPEVVTPAAGSRWRWLPIIAVGLAALELASRAEDRIAYGMPFMSRVISSNELLLKDSVGARGRPNAIFRRWRLDSLGFRGPDIAREPGPGVVRIVTSGASETFGLYESAGKEYPRQFEDSLRARVAAACGPGAPPVEVVNGAMPGMALPSLTRHLAAVVAPIKPSIVTLYPSPAFYLNDRAPVPAVPSRGDTTLDAANAFKLRFVDRLVTQAKSLTPKPVMTWSRQRVTRRRVQRFPEGWRFTGVPEERVQQFDADLRAVIGAIRAIGAQPMLVGYVNKTMTPGFDDPDLLIAWEYQFPRAPGALIPTFHAEVADRIVQIARDSSVAYVDLARALDGRWEGTFADFVHFTDAGAAAVAAALASSLAPTGSGPSCTISPVLR